MPMNFSGYFCWASAQPTQAQDVHNNFWEGYMLHLATCWHTSQALGHLVESSWCYMQLHVLSDQPPGLAG